MMIPDQNIDPLFNDLKDLEVSPSNRVWEGIEKHLDKKKKRLIPLFWRIGAAASVLLVIGFLLFDKSETGHLDDQMANQDQPSTQETPEKVTIAQRFDKKDQEAGVDVDQGVLSGEIEKGASEKTKKEENLISPQAAFPKEMNADQRVVITHLASLEEEKEERADDIYEKMVAHSYIPGSLGVESPKGNGLVIKNNEKTVYPLTNSTEPMTNEEVTRSSLKFVLGGEYSPTYAFREVSGGVASNNSESGINKAGGGISLAVKVNSRWQIETGVKYAMLGQEVSTNSRSDRVYSFSEAQATSRMDIMEVNLSNSLGAVNPTVSPAKLQDASGFQSSANELVELQYSDFSSSGSPLLEQNLGYLQVPLTVRYQLLQQSRLSLSLSGGISTNWLVDNDAYLEMGSEKKRIGRTRGLSDMGFSTHAGVAVSLPVFNGFHLRMEPRIDYFISDVSKDSPGSFRPYSFGVFTGLFYEW